MRPEDLFHRLVQSHGSDLILRVGGRPSIRVDGTVEFISDVPVTPALAQQTLEFALDARQQELFFKVGEADAAFEIPGVGRFRVNVFRQRGKIGFVFRHIKSTVPSIDSLNLPEEQIIRLA
jgi:twitching motility protein PilT